MSQQRNRIGIRIAGLRQTTQTYVIFSVTTRFELDTCQLSKIHMFMYTNRNMQSLRNLPRLLLCVGSVTKLSSCLIRQQNAEGNKHTTVLVQRTVSLFMARQPPPLPVGHGLLIHEVSGSHIDAPQSVGLPWTSDQPVAETST